MICINRLQSRLNLAHLLYSFLYTLLHFSFKFICNYTANSCTWSKTNRSSNRKTCKTWPDKAAKPSQNYETASYGRQQRHPSQDYISIPVNKSSLTTIDIFQLKILVNCYRINVNWYMLIEEAEKLYTSLIKEGGDKIITYYTFSSPQS